MTVIKNAIANSPIYLGLFLKTASQLLFNLGFKLHITFNTEAGIKLRELDKIISATDDTVKTQPQTPTKRQRNPDRKLADIILGDKDGQPSGTSSEN